MKTFHSAVKFLMFLTSLAPLAPTAAIAQSEPLNHSPRVAFCIGADKGVTADLYHDEGGYSAQVFNHYDQTPVMPCRFEKNPMRFACEGECESAPAQNNDARENSPAAAPAEDLSCHRWGYIFKCCRKSTGECWIE